MLSRENVLQILAEHEVFRREPQARSQHLDVVLLAMGERRARYLRRASRFEDGIFAAWAICLPIFPQNRTYTQLMRARRAKWFSEVPTGMARERAVTFFKDELFGLELHQLGALVMRSDATRRIAPYLR